MKRTFHVFTEPHVADPAWICPVVEMVDIGGGAALTPIHKADATPLMTVAWELQFDLGKSAGRVEEEVRARKYLTELGWGTGQIHEFLTWKDDGGQ